MSTPSDIVAVEAARGAEPSGAERYVEALAVLPGAEHVVVVDVAGERVLGEWGGPPGSARAVLDRARRAADPSRHGRRELEDTVSTIGSAFHLSRLVLAGPGHPESVWVAVRIDRARGNLTWARGVLGGLGGPAGSLFAGPATPARDGQRSHPDAADDAPRPPHVGGAASAPRASAVVPPPPPPPAPSITSQSADPVAPPATPVAPPATPVAPPATPVAAPATPKAPVAPRAQVALKATVVPTGPVAPAASAGTGTSTSETASTASSPSWTATTSETAIAETAATIELMAPLPAVPAARTSPENRPEPLPGPDQRSSFAPVMVVPPPPSPVPDDGTTEEPAPMPAPTISAPPLPSDGRRVENESAAGPDEAHEAGPPDHARPGLPRRTPGVHLVPRPPGPTAVPPARPASSGTDAIVFTDEPSAVRRLINGLRRPS